MKLAKPFGLSLPVTVLLLLALYLVVMIDVVTGLNLNLFGYGRERSVFSVGVVVLCFCLYACSQRGLAIIGLIFCCAWLTLYPEKNGFDVVLSPLLVTSLAQWLWTRHQLKT